MYAIALLEGMVFYGPISTLYRQAQGLSIFSITLIESISLILTLIMEIPWGIIADNIGYKKTMVVCSVLFFVSKIVFWIANGFWLFLLERVILSIVVSGMSGVDISILYLSCKEETQKIFGIYNSSGVAGLLIASVVFAVFVGDDYGKAGIFTVISYGAAAFASFFLIEVKEYENRSMKLGEFRATLLQIMKNKYLFMLLISVAFVTETHQVVTVFLNQLQYEKCGLSATIIGYIYVAVTLAGLLAVFSDKFTKRFGMKTAGTMLQVIIILSCVLLAYTRNAVTSAGGIMMMHIANSIFQPLQMEWQNKQVLTANRATELSIYAMIIDSIGAGTNLLFGILAAVELSLAFWGGVGLCFTGLFLFLVWCDHQKGAN